MLILGEERTGKTSLYRLLVRKGFNPDQDSTKGIDNTVVETIDVRHVASDTWEEKTIDDQKKQSKNLFALGIVKEVKKELPLDKEVVSTKTFHSSRQRLMDAIQRIEKMLADVEHENQHQYLHKFNQQSHQHKPNLHTGLKEVKPAVVSVPSTPTPQSHILHQPTKQDTGSKVMCMRDTSDRHTSGIHTSQNPGEKKLANLDTDTTTTPKKVTFDDEVPKQKPSAHPKEIESSPPINLPKVQLSRGHSKEISKLMKSEDQEHKELSLIYNTLDFAGQKEYHPMHHCFITRRAIYLVIFNLQKVIDYITRKKLVTDNPLEQIRYWLHSIHAHIFPPDEDDRNNITMRRVCLVGTHRVPKNCEEITEEKMKQINDELKTLERDGKCVSHLHYTSNPERMFIAVENSMDNIQECKLSGALQLQRELKEVSDNLSFLKEDHPNIWLNFEAQLVESYNSRKSHGLPVIISEQEVFAMALQHGIEAEDDQRLALDFFHDTGKIICLSKCNSYHQEHTCV